MCGIWGYSGNIAAELSTRAHNFLYALAQWSETRGTDSTGFACRYDSGHVIVDKMPVRATAFGMLSHKWIHLRKKMPSTLIGHTRFGTGSTPLINNNNHPFLGRDFHMVHNGVIPSWRDIQRNQQLPMQSETDSEVILRCLEKRMEAKDDINKSVEWVLDNIWGNMAVAMLEKNNPNVWLFRNDNPIWVFSIPEGIFGHSGIMFFASTEDIFNNAWKEVFKKGPEKFGVTAQCLDDNHLFRISTKAVKITGSNQKHRFVVFGLKVAKKYNKALTYYNGTSHVDYQKNWQTSSSDEFFSHLPNPDSPINGCRFGKDIQEKMTSRIAEKDTSKVRIDGMSLVEYSGLRGLMATLEKMESKMLIGEEDIEDELLILEPEPSVESLERIENVVSGPGFE